MPEIKTRWVDAETLNTGDVFVWCGRHVAVESVRIAKHLKHRRSLDVTVTSVEFGRQVLRYYSDESVGRL